MSPDMKFIFLANMDVKLLSWTLTFHMVVQQQIWGEVVLLTQAKLLHRSFMNLTVKKIWKLVDFCGSIKIKVVDFFLKHEVDD